MKKVLPFLCALCLVGCGIEKGASLEIVGESIPDDNCVAPAQTQEFRSRGAWDPRGSFDVPPGGAYMMPLVLKNNLVLADADTATSFSSENRRVDANTLQVIGFDVCWVRADLEGGPAEASRYGSWTDGVPSKLQCSNLPASQRAWVPTSTSIDPDGTTAGIFVDVLSESALQSLYGSAFLPRNIPPVGRADAVSGEASPTGAIYISAPVSPLDEPRDVAWGSYPHSYLATVLVQLRATAKDQAGTTVQSNWFVHAIELCVGCSADMCGPRTVHVLTSGDLCLSGEAVNLSNTCLPAQGYEISCEALNACS